MREKSLLPSSRIMTIRLAQWQEVLLQDSDVLHPRRNCIFLLETVSGAHSNPWPSRINHPCEVKPPSGTVARSPYTGQWYFRPWMIFSNKKYNFVRGVKYILDPGWYCIFYWKQFKEPSRIMTSDWHSGKKSLYRTVIFYTPDEIVFFFIGNSFRSPQQPMTM